MVTERQGLSGRGAWLVILGASAFLACLGVPTRGSCAAPDGDSIALAETAEQGAFNVGAARVELNRSFDPTVGSTVWKLDYTLPRGTAAGLWAKGFPDRLNPANSELIRLSVHAADAAQLQQLGVAVELKGTAGTQRIPLTLQPGWTHREVLLDWPAIGKLTEVVVLLQRTGAAESAVGTLALDVRFEQLSWQRKVSISPAARLGGVLALGLLGALFTGLLRVGLGRRPRPHPTDETDPAWLDGLRRDFVQAVGVVGTAVLGGTIYILGERGPLEAGWTALWVALAGAALAEFLKVGLTGKHLTSGEVFLSMLASGLPAASASPLVLLQVPAAWSDVLLLSQTAAAATVLAYHVANLCRLSASGRPLGTAVGGLIVATPYVIGSLLLLRSDSLLRSLGGELTARALADSPALLTFVGRVVVVFGFNLAVVHGLSLATRRTLLRSFTAQLALLAVAVAVIAAPWIAAWGSGDPILGTAVSIASWPALLRTLAVVGATMLSQAGLWAEVYLITGVVLDALHRQAPFPAAVRDLPLQGMKKAVVFSGLFMAVIQVPDLLWGVTEVRELAANYPMAVATLLGALSFPFIKAVIETFEGSPSFSRRVAMSYRHPVLYLRGAVVGLGLGTAIALSLAGEAIEVRLWFGFGVGALAFAGGNFLSDCVLASRGQGRPQAWRVYLVQTLLGGFVGAALGFYFDAAQVATVAAKAQLYLSFGDTPKAYSVTPFLSKWGTIHLGYVTGGASLLFAESLAGVIEWSIPAWLFAINRTFLLAYFRKELAPLKGLFTRDGLVALTQNMIEVLRWGLWMSPIIKSFLRPVGEPTWYNQDGAIRTLIAIVQDVRLDSQDFRAWSLQVFIALLAYDAVRILIWLDHFGLRVATLVNLSFLGMDRLDGRLARFLAPAATARCIPEAIKRFTTWAPLLIPFYIPRGADWDYAWAQHEEIRRSAGAGPLAQFVALPLPTQTLLLAAAIAATTVLFAAVRWLRGRAGLPRIDRSLANDVYEVVLTGDGAVFSQVPDRAYDVSRRSYDRLDPAGRALFLVDDTAVGQGPRAWPVLGNFPGFAASVRVEQDERNLTVCHTRDGLRVTVAIALPGATDPAELWTVTVENLSAEGPRSVKVVPYLEWVLNRADADRGHTQYNRLFAEMEYVRGLHAILAWDKHAKAMGVLAADVAPDGFLTARVGFLGRARSVWTPRVLETLAFARAADTAAHPTLDPIGSLLVGLTVPPHGAVQFRLLIGQVSTKAQAIDLIARHLQIPGAAAISSERVRAQFHPIGHGEIPPGTPQPYTSLGDDGRRLLVHTPFTPRPFDHTLSNHLGHVVSVTNRGLHTSSSVNAQQNRLTPDWPDTVTRELPGEAFYLYDPEQHEWYSPTYHPLNDATADYEAEFGVDGTATFHMARGELATELTVFVPPEEPVGVYLLTVRNRGTSTRRLRYAPYFQMVLAPQPEHAGPLRIRRVPALNALFVQNPRNTFRTGPAFVALSHPAEQVETQRGRFFGASSDVARPTIVERGELDSAPTADERPVAAFLTTLEVPAQGECTIVVLLGQADNWKQAEAVIRRLQSPAAARIALEATRSWWRSLMDTVRVQTTNPEFDHYLDWLKYQALAERIWARRGFYQASGAFGFRDQLQDAVNLLWVDPVLARRQILLHASQQFREGDVVHWFHLLQDGRTGFVGRTHASDNLLWLPWAVVEYVAATGDDSLLDERTPYLEAEQPFEPLPAGKHGMGFDPLRSAREDTVYRHCLKAIDLVLEKRMGAHGLPLMGTGDWNDGLDEIGSRGRGESVWLGLFLAYILERMAGLVGRRAGHARQEHYRERLQQLKDALERTWRGDRYLRAIHDDGTEIGMKGSGVWEIDALTAAWAVMAGLNPERCQIVFETALRTLEKETTILLGWPPLREDTKPYLGRSSGYPEGVRENGMYCHGVQWLVGAARILADRCQRAGDLDEASRYRETAYRLWLKISPLPHVVPGEIETYGGQPNKQAADLVTTFDPGRMIWNGYTGSAGWMFRQALEGVLGLRLAGGAFTLPPESTPAGDLNLVGITRDVTRSPFPGPPVLRPTTQDAASRQATPQPNAWVATRGG